LSLSYFNEWSCQLWERWDESQKGAFKYARKAVELDESDSVSLLVLGRIYLYKGDYEKGEYYLRKSLKLNPNDAGNLSQLAVSFVYLGYIDEAEELYRKAKRLNPLNEFSYNLAGSLIYFESGRYEEAIEIGLKTDFDKVWVDLPAMMAAAYYHLGDMENMKKYWKIYEKYFKKRILHGKKAERFEALRWIIAVNPIKGKSNYVPFFEYMKNEKNNGEERKSEIKPESSALNIFRRGSGLWEMNFEGKSIFLPDVKGYHDIQKLLKNPNKELHCNELMGNPVVINDGEFVLDDKAKDAYKKKINDLSLEIDEAELMNDTHRAAELRKEYEELIDHLSRSLGLGGKSRKLNSSVEKSRSAVTWRIRSAIKKIESAHPSLSRHLSKSVKTGIFCSYSPEKETAWDF
jgi:tetratricopeptide (TPR) repeat protein